ncbi:MAG: hypothetical protein A2174_02670, partial [Candidatus Portnoybacteria bacterium RBG_13_41_18]
EIFPHAKLIKSSHNYFVGGAANRALDYANGEYVLLLCADVILKEDFLEKGIEIFMKDSGIGVLQAKILKFSLSDNRIRKTEIIDTTGFLIFKSGRIINRGHGEEDKNQFREGEIFSYEGAAGFFRKKALDEAKIDGELFDEDFGWMADDIDLGWRLRNFGWKNYYAPGLICWHDRKTTKRLSQSRLDFIRQRRDVPPLKRRLDFQNTILTLIKNMSCKNFLKHFFTLLSRQIMLGIYIVAFEFSSISAFFGIIRLLPRILKKRRDIMKRKKMSFQEMENWMS